jgi:glutamate-1-semialdehyde 2,1-aminomutase
MLAMRTMRAMLEEVMTDAAYARHVRAGPSGSGPGAEGGDRAASAGVARDADRRAQSNSSSCPRPLRNGSEAAAATRPDLEQMVALFLINCGVLIAPFHNMMLTSPATTADQIAHFLHAFDACAAALAGHA